jgi:ABC-type nitrate/sulfonate/bicarbonate transport system substrate-binding protein
MLFCLVQFSAFAHALDQVTLQLKWFHQFQFAGYYAAIEKGFYSDEGLEVTLRENNPEEDRIGSVVDGSAEYGISDTGLMLARQQGVPVVLLAQFFQHSPLVLITKQSSGIRTPYDLIGRPVQVDSIGISQAPILATALTNHSTMRKMVLP